MRTVEVSDDEVRVLLRLLDDKWFDLDRESELEEHDLMVMRDIESLQRKLV